MLRHVYAHADHVVTYGEHVSAFARAQGSRRVTVAPQAVDNAFWSTPGDPAATGLPPGVTDPDRYSAMFAGRPVREKGLQELLTAWRKAALPADDAVLVLAGVEATDLPRNAPDAAFHAVGHQTPVALRNFLAAASVLVIPSVPTPTFREPWALIANEAMNQRKPIIATDAVGAAAGGLVRHERNGLIVPAGDTDALADALLRLQRDKGLARTLGEHAARDVAPFTHDAWAAAFASVLDGLLARGPRPCQEGLLA